uniref:Uncharacterized protein n=1 Tax=Micrurus lemniscatus lemniscatus TaxID=129467 RepID=A0A2D4H738_MICLE
MPYWNSTSAVSATAKRTIGQKGWLWRSSPTTMPSMHPLACPRSLPVTASIHGSFRWLHLTSQFQPWIPSSKSLKLCIKWFETSWRKSRRTTNDSQTSIVETSLC